MKIIDIKDKMGKVLKTKDDVTLQDFFFEVGDFFIPKYNKLITRTNKAKVNGKIRTINSHKVLCSVKDKDGEMIKTNTGSTEIFVSITPAQFNTLNKKLIENIDINQRMFTAYNYDIEDKETKEISTYIGVGFKSDFKKAKSFDDFDTDKFEAKTDE